MAGPSHQFEGVDHHSPTSLMHLYQAAVLMDDMAQPLDRESSLLYTPKSQSTSVSTTSIKRERSPSSQDFYLPPHKRRHNGYLAPFASLDVGVKIETTEEELYSPSPQSAAALYEDISSCLNSSTDAKPTWAEEPFHIPAWPERRRPNLFLQHIPPYIDECAPVFSPDGVSPRTTRPSMTPRKDSIRSTDSESEPKSQQPSHLTLPVSASPLPIIFREPFAPCLRHCVAPKHPQQWKNESGPDSPDYVEVFEIEQVSPSLYPSLEPHPDLHHRELISVPHPRSAYPDLETSDVEISYLGLESPYADLHNPEPDSRTCSESAYPDLEMPDMELSSPCSDSGIEDEAGGGWESQ